MWGAPASPAPGAEGAQQLCTGKPRVRPPISVTLITSLGPGHPPPLLPTDYQTTLSPLPSFSVPPKLPNQSCRESAELVWCLQQQELGNPCRPLSLRMRGGTTRAFVTRRAVHLTTLQAAFSSTLDVTTGQTIRGAVKIKRKKWDVLPLPPSLALGPSGFFQYINTYSINIFQNFDTSISD